MTGPLACQSLQVIPRLLGLVKAKCTGEHRSTTEMGGETTGGDKVIPHGARVTCGTLAGQMLGEDIQLI